MGDVEEFRNAGKAIDQASGRLVFSVGFKGFASVGSFLYKVFHHLEEFPYSKGVEGLGRIKTIHRCIGVLMGAFRAFGQ